MNLLKQLAEDIIKKPTLIFVCFAFCSLFFLTSIRAQSISQTDSISVKISSLADTSKFIMQKSAWGSVLRSAILPGFGQYYNESYWKIPLFLGVLGYLGYQWNANNNTYKTYRDLYYNNLINNSVAESFYKEREFYRDQRDMFAVFIGLTYFLNLVDAYVDAHLFDFDVETDQVSGNYLLSLKIRF
ncbi:MAG: hypothetical protein FD143_238 [Ignavibacteria bacterium]|nr:MAG: hypothetical protein FD143_238 [Ignavibacteria bacterium]KAF0162073.1 MAG: hypothetical protein FD188_322 [Ignavibacteria bacterium]